MCDVRLEVVHMNSRFIKRGGYRFGDSKLVMAQDGTASSQEVDADLGGAATGDAPRIRIGPEKNEYIYTQHGNIWICQKGSKNADKGQVLVLAVSTRTLKWTAYDVAHPDAWDTAGIPVFEYVGEGNPTTAGEHKWLMSWNRSRESPDWREMRGAFWTTALER